MKLIQFREALPRNKEDLPAFAHCKRRSFHRKSRAPATQSHVHYFHHLKEHGKEIRLKLQRIKIKVVLKLLSPDDNDHRIDRNYYEYISKKVKIPCSTSICVQLIIEKLVAFI